MDIARMSTQRSQADLHYRVSVAVLKMAMEEVTEQTDDLVESRVQANETMELSVQPHLGQNVDFSA